MEDPWPDTFVNLPSLLRLQLALRRLDSGLWYQKVRDDCQDQDHRHDEDGASGQTIRPALCSGEKNDADDESCE